MTSNESSIHPSAAAMNARRARASASRHHANGPSAAGAAEGLVERSPDDDDKRVARVSTTRAGDALLERIRTRKNAWLAARLAKLDDDQRARLAAALDVLDQLSTDAP